MMRRDSKWGKILICAALSVSLLAAGCAKDDTGTGASEQEAAKTAESQGGASGEPAEEIVFHPPVDTPCVVPGEKEETVYVKADASGNPTEKTVEVILKKIEGTDPVEDRSNLSDIKNTEGDEEFSTAGEGRYLWENHGEDIHYKGISQEPLPVDVRITYYLEGQEVSADEIAGKTGAVKIRFDYENHTEVPFMVLSAALLSGDSFSDVEVENGKVMDMGEQKAVIGYAFPGLSDNLKLAEYEPTEEVELPAFVEITARAENFELNFTATVVSTGLFDEIEDEDLQDLEDMSDDVDELTDASEELTDAAEELADGGSEFGGYLSQYFDGISQISEGTDALDQGLQALNTNFSKITEGSGALQEGLSQVDKSLSQIDLSSLSSEESEEAAKAAAEALQSLGQNTASLSEKLTAVRTAVEGLGTYVEYLNTYSEKVEALKTAVDENPAPVLTELAPDLENDLNQEASAQANAAVKEAATKAAQGAVEEAAQNAAKATASSARDAAKASIEASSALDDCGLTEEQIAQIKDQLIAEVRESIEEDAGGAAEVTVDPETVEISLGELLGTVLTQMQTEIDGKYANITTAREEVEELTVLDMSALSGEQIDEIGQILTEMGQSLTVVSAYAQGLSSTAESLKELAAGMEKLKDGVSKLSKGSEQLSEGLSVFEEALGKASEGSGQLNSALNEVTSAGGELRSAYWKLVEGMDAFADGVAEFDEEGIQSLAELAGPEYLSVIRGVRAARDAEHSYTNFSGICEGQKGSVKFIIETEEISSED